MKVPRVYRRMIPRVSRVSRVYRVSRVSRVYRVYRVYRRDEIRWDCFDTSREIFQFGSKISL